MFSHSSPCSAIITFSYSIWAFGTDNFCLWKAIKIYLCSFETLCHFRLFPPSTTWLWQFLILKQRHLQVPALLQGFSLKLHWLGQFVSLFSCFGGLDPALFTLWWQTRFPLNTVLIPFSKNRSLTCVLRVVKLFPRKTAYEIFKSIWWTCIQLSFC